MITTQSVFYLPFVSWRLVHQKRTILKLNCNSLVIMLYLAIIEENKSAVGNLIRLPSVKTLNELSLKANTLFFLYLDIVH